MPSESRLIAAQAAKSPGTESTLSVFFSSKLSRTMKTPTPARIAKPE